MTPAWVTKHQYHVPAVFVIFFELACRPDISSGEVDSELKAEINAVKSTLSTSGFRSRLAVVIVPSNASAAVENAEERLNSIRRVTGLDVKTSFFYFPTTTSQQDCANFAVALVTALRPTCLEYYRDMAKHARRKRGRGFLPVSTSSRTATSLSTQSWNARYDFKMGIFAEFRGEWDAAEKHFLSATDNMFDSEGPLSRTTPLRRDHVLLFADIIALRLLQCELMRGHWNTAAEQWAKHQRRVTMLQDESGLLSDTLTRAQWDARWTSIMAELVDRLDVDAFRPQADKLVLPNLDEHDEQSRERQAEKPNLNTFFTVSESASGPNDRVIPFQLLHHPGYWYALAVEKSGLLSDEGKVNRISDMASRAATLFDERGQHHGSNRMVMLQACALVQAGSHAEALKLLEPVWHQSLWRTGQWWTVFSELLSLMYTAASESGAGNLLLELRLESMCFQSSTMDLAAAKPAPTYDNTVVNMAESDRVSPVTITLAFAKTQGFIGDAIPCQVVVSCNTQMDQPLLSMGSLMLAFNSDCRINLTHQARSDSTSATQLVQLGPSSPAETNHFTGHADLQPSKGQPLVLNLHIPLRTTGLLTLLEARTTLQLCGAELNYTQTAALSTTEWWLETADGVKHRDRRRPKSHIIHILPKPPRVAIRLPAMEPQYFTDERVRLVVQVDNEENTGVTGVLGARLSERSGEGRLRLALGPDDAADPVKTLADDTDSAMHNLETLPSGSSRVYQLWVDAPAQASEIDFAITVEYELEESEPRRSDSDATVLPSACTRTLDLKMTFVEPFKIGLELLPRHGTDTWPDFFAVSPFEEAGRSASGIAQAWLMRCSLTNTAMQALEIETAEMSNDDALTPVECTFGQADLGVSAVVASRKGTLLQFPFLARAKVLEDRKAASLAANITIRWRRHMSTEGITTTKVPVPKYMIPPVEPRVLCVVSASRTVHGVPSVELTYSLENPSMHFLTFNVGMQASTEFAFQGSKRKSVSLTPMSRCALVYTLYVHGARSGLVSRDRLIDGKTISQQGRWVTASLSVVDAYYQKTLRVLAASDDVRHTDQGGLEIWVMAAGT